MKLKHTILALALMSGATNAASIAINWTADRDGSAATQGTDTTVTLDAFGVTSGNWTNVSVADGTDNISSTTVDGVTVAWSATQNWTSGENTSTGEGQVYNGYIDEDGSLDISGLSAWLAGTGDASYTIQILQSTDFGTSFADTAVSVSNGGASLGTLTNGATNGSAGILSGASSTLTGLTSDTLFIDPPARNASERATLSGLIITSVPVPEPSSMALLGLGSLALIRRKRR